MSAEPARNDRVAVPTPSGNLRLGTVVDERLETSADANRRLLTVAVEGVHLVVDECDVEPYPR